MTLDNCTCGHGAVRHETDFVDTTGQEWGGGLAKKTNCLDCPSLNRDHYFSVNPTSSPSAPAGNGRAAPSPAGAATSDLDFYTNLGILTAAAMEGKIKAFLDLYPDTGPDAGTGPRSRRTWR